MVESVDHAIELAMPTKAHQNHERLFTLARAVKSLEKNNGPFTPAQLCEVFNRWYQHATDFLKPGQTHTDYQTEFMKAYQSAKVPLDEGIFREAWKLAQENPTPPEAELFEDEKMRLAVALCRELQLKAGDEPFFLSARKLQKLLNLECHNTAAKWLVSFRVLKILTEISKGSGLKASRYRYVFTENNAQVKPVQKVIIPKRSKAKTQTV